MNNDQTSPGYLDFDAGVGGEQDSTNNVRDAINKFVVPLNNRAIMPDGSSLSREQILARLGLNPGTRPDAWLAIVACGSNASALNFGQAREVATRNLVRAAGLVESLNKLQDSLASDTGSETTRSGSEGSYASGGTAPGSNPK